MYKVGLSSGGFDLTEANFKALRESDIHAIEISMSAEKYKDIDYKGVKALSERYAVDLWSFHLPFMPFSAIDPSHLDETVRRRTVAYFAELIHKATDIGIDKFVVHASGEPIAEAERAERMKRAMQTLDELAKVAHTCGAVVAVEDLPRTCLGHTSEEILALLSANDKLRVCFDTNHLLCEDNVAFMKRLADKIVTVHVSDYDFVNERHWLPGEGKLDWNAMLSTFREIGYDGVWMYEVALACPKTIVRDRDLTFDDFRRNADAVFSRTKLPVLGVPKENLGMWE